jgi:hypothetical protein
LTKILRSGKVVAVYKDENPPFSGPKKVIALIIPEKLLALMNDIEQMYGSELVNDNPGGRRCQGCATLEYSAIKKDGSIAVIASNDSSGNSHRKDGLGQRETHILFGFWTLAHTK